MDLGGPGPLKMCLLTLKVTFTVKKENIVILKSNQILLSWHYYIKMKINTASNKKRKYNNQIFTWITNVKEEDRA